MLDSALTCSFGHGEPENPCCIIAVLRQSWRNGPQKEPPYSESHAVCFTRKAELWQVHCRVDGEGKLCLGMEMVPCATEIGLGCFRPLCNSGFTLAFLEDIDGDLEVIFKPV